MGKMEGIIGNKVVPFTGKRDKERKIKSFVTCMISGLQRIDLLKGCIT
jgi:hypothetical protein